MRGTDRMERGTITAIIGPMFSKKTTRLIEIYDTLNPASARIFKPEIDDRYGKNTIGTHNGSTRPAIVCANSKDFRNYMYSHLVNVALIDEAQFFDANIVDTIDEVVNSGVDVYFTALNQNYMGEPFKFANSDRHIGELIASADYVESRTAICDICGEAATKTQRLIGLEQEVLIGGSEAYTARCSKHHSAKLHY